MKCATCQRTSPDDAAYCCYCGRMRVAICDQCQRPSPHDAIYCCYCGAKMSVPEFSTTGIEQGRPQIKLDLGPTLSKIVHQQEGEKIVGIWNALYSIHSSSARGKKEKQQLRGPLVQTDRRLILMEKPSFSSNFQIREDLELKKVKGAIRLESNKSIVDFIRLDTIKISIDEGGKLKEIILWNIVELDPQSMKEGKAVSPSQLLSSINRNSP